ncbi:MAG TPA: hypothetical protein VMA98_10730 [Candidatus Acidoferrales bacterium]|nr:hypothetical protein [Candidatus Acidoferrales bacterium]
MRSLCFAFLAIAALAVAAACSNGRGYVPGPTLATATPGASPSASADVAFVFTVPTPAPAARKRNITVPSSAESVAITLVSVNGSPEPSSSPTILNLSSSTSGCSGTNPLTCDFTIPAPVGTLVYTIQVFSTSGASGTPIAEGNLSVTTTAGTTASAPVTTTGTIAKIVLSVSDAAEEGVAGNVPVVIQAEDSNGYTILGTYNTAITLSDTDASAQTSLSATNIPDSTTAAAVTLDYLGGVMSGAATISATASGVSSSNITAASFLPDATNPAVASSAEFSSTYAYSYWANGADPEPTQSYGPSYYTYTEAIATASPTASPFAGLSNVITLYGDDYFNWSTQNGTLELSYLGYYDNQSPWIYTDYCEPGAEIEFEVPVPSSWSVFASGLPCIYTEAFNTEASDPTDYSLYQVTTPSTGSYSLTYSYNYGSGDVGSGSVTYDAAEDGTIISSDPDQDYYDGSYYLYVPATTSTTVNASYLFYPGPSPLPSPLPSASPIAAPNPYQYVLNGSGGPPNPLQSDVYTNEGTIAATSLPAGCTVASGIIPSGASLTHLQEVAVYADPLEWNDELQYGWTEDYYYLAGVGLVCDSYSESEYNYDDGSALDYYDGNDQTIDGYQDSETDYLTTTTLAALLAQSRSMTAAEQKASAIFAAAVHAHHRQEHRQRLAAMRKRQAAHRKQPASKRN